MKAIDIIASLMEASAITAPKSVGQNFVKTKILNKDILQKLSDAMLEYGKKTGKKDFDRDSKGVASAESVLLIGIKDATVVGLDCQACGFESCKDLNNQVKTTGEFKGPICALRLLDMGIALGSAVKTADIHNVDNRIMYRIGVVAKETGLVDWDFIMGIPMSISGKNIFFDR